FEEEFFDHSTNNIIPTKVSDSTMLNSKKLLLSFLLICMVVTPPPAKVVAITCGTVHNIMHPYCHKYALFGESFPSECCNELKSLISNITISADHQSACSCMKGLAFTEKTSEPSG
ncbi:hypothetical protein AABB24_010398, partial [Solanum stoloniferum]